RPRRDDHRARPGVSFRVSGVVHSATSMRQPYGVDSRGAVARSSMIAAMRSGERTTTRSKRAQSTSGSSQTAGVARTPRAARGAVSRRASASSCGSSRQVARATLGQRGFVSHHAHSVQPGGTFTRSRCTNMKRTTSPTELLLRIDRDTRVPMRVQLESELRRAIQTGRLEAGAVLPSTRSLAADLDVARGVVVEAYEQLLAEGYLSAHEGSATRVAGRRTVDREPAPDDVAPLRPRYDFRPGVPDLSLFPRRAWLAALRRAFASLPDAAFDYPDPRGTSAARRTLAAYLNRARATVARE